MASLETHFAESTGRSTTTSSTMQDKATLTYTPTASSTYYDFWCGILDNSATTADSRAQLYNSTSAVVLGGFNMESADSTDRACVGGIAKETTGGSPSSTTWKVQYSSESATAAIAEARLASIKSTGNEKYSESLGNSSTTSSTPQAKVTLTDTFTAGDWYIFASAELVENGVTVYTCRLDVDGTDYGTMDSIVTDVTGKYPWVCVKKVNLTAASHTIKIEYSANGTDQCTISNGRVLAFPASDFAAAQYAEDTTLRTRTGAGSNSYADGASLNFTPANKEHFVFCSAVFGENSTTNSAQVKFLQDATNKGESIREPQSTAVTLQSMYWNFHRETLAAASTTWKFQYLTESTSSVVSLDEQVIAVLQTEESAVTLTVQDGAHAHAAESPSFSQNHVYAINDGSHGHAADNMTLAQVHDFIIAGSDHAHAADEVTLATQHILTSADALHDHAAEAGTFTQDHVLVEQDATHAHAADSATFAQVHTVAIDDATHDQTADGATFTQNHDYAPADASHALTSDTADFTQVHSFAVDDASHGHAAESGSFAQNHVLSADEATHAHAADETTVSEEGAVLSPADATHAHAADEVPLEGILVIADAAHDHGAENATFAQVHSFSPGDAIHALTSETATFDVSVTIQDGAHAVTSEETTFAQNHDYTANDATHGHTAESATFAQVHSLVAQDALHDQAAEEVSFETVVILAAADGSHAVFSDECTFSQVHVLGISDALHAHLADNTTVTQLFILAVSDADHAHAADSPTLAQIHLLAVEGAMHLIASEDATFSQTHSFSIQECLHAHAATAADFLQQHTLSIEGTIHLHAAQEVVVAATGAFIIDADRVLYVPLSSRSAISTHQQRLTAPGANERLRNTEANDRILLIPAKDRTT